MSKRRRHFLTDEERQGMLLLRLSNLDFGGGALVNGKLTEPAKKIITSYLGKGGHLKNVAEMLNCPSQLITAELETD